MSMHIIRKALGLLIVDIVLIIGIFVLQFRTDSTILEKIGNLQITLALTEAENNVSELKNKLQVTFNGVNFYCDDQSPAQIMRKGSGKKTNVVLKSWDKDDHSFKLEFSEGVTVVFSVSSEAPDASLSTAVKLPSTVSSFYLPYNFNYNMKIQKDEGSRVIVDGRRSSWEMSAANLSTGYVTFTRENSIASYAVYDNSHTFSFEALVDIALANPSTYNTTVSNFKSNVISAFKANTAEANLTEQAVVSYVAAQAEKGNYVQAIEEIPQSFKKSKSRTYLSAPFFNNLAEMNVILDKTLAEKVVIDEEDNTTITLTNNTDFLRGEETSLTISFPGGVSFGTPFYRSSLSFKSGSTATAITYPTGIIWSGFDIKNGQFVPVAGKYYNIVFWRDSFGYNAVVRGVWV